MAALLEDGTAWAKYFGVDPDSPNDGPACSDSEHLSLRLFEWYSGNTQEPWGGHVWSASELIRRDNDKNSTCSLRVVFAPLQPSGDESEEAEAFRLIFKHYSFPSGCVRERLQDANCAFGAQLSPLDPDVSLAWTRLLCKDIQIETYEVVDGIQFYKIVDRTRSSIGGGSQSSSTWNELDVLVHTRTNNGTAKCVTMFCFGRMVPLVERFRRLLSCPSWKDAVDEPCLLFSIVFEEWYKTFDEVTWRLADVFRPLEIWTLQHAKRSLSKEVVGRIDFAGLHNLSKHCSYMLEAAEAALLTLESMILHHRFIHTGNTTTVRNAAASSLAYRKTTFQSTQLRLRSLEKRMGNLISLSFNLVTSQDSIIMQNDSNAMKAIAVLTLIFLPLTGIGSVFSTPFFNVDFDTPEKILQLAKTFWIFWAITIPLTLFFFGSWFGWYERTKRRRMDITSPNDGQSAAPGIETHHQQRRAFTFIGRHIHLSPQNLMQSQHQAGTA